jgi:membrane protease YdiL (CAAX protease family)
MERIDLLTFWLLMIFGAFVPYVVVKAQRAVRAGATIPSRTKIYRNVLIMQALFLLAAMVAARSARIDVFAPGDIRAMTVVAAIALLALAVAVSRLIWRSTPDDLRRRLLISRPHHYGELGWWILVSLAAGVVEEIVYRGVLPSLLESSIARWMGSTAIVGAAPFGGAFTAAWGIAVAISVVVFVLGHYGQGAPRAMFLAVFSLVCHVLVRTSGSLYLAMAFHTLYDVFAGVFAIRAARESEAARREANSPMAPI